MRKELVLPLPEMMDKICERECCTVHGLCSNDVDECRSEVGRISFRKIIHATAEFFSGNASVMAGILGSNIMGTLMAKVEDEIVNYFPQILDNPSDAYTAVFYSGAIVSVFRAWSESGMKESVDEITNLICGIIGDEVMNRFEEKMN